jgi:outer membrane protein assembly factor BamB
MQNKIVILLLCILTVSVFVNAVAADDWPMAHHDADHTGYTTSNGPLTNSTLWTFKTINKVESSAAVANGYVYVSCGDIFYYTSNVMVYCLNAQTGALVWNFTPGGYCFTPAVANGYVYLGSYDNHLYCLNATTGIQVWNYSAGSYDDVYAPIVTNGYVYVGTSFGGLLCINATTGVLVWDFAASGAAAYNPSVSGGYVYVGCSSGTVYCLNALTGTPVWNYTTNGGVQDAPVVYNGNVYFGSGGPFTGHYNVTCLNALTGAFVWNFVIPTGEFGDVAVANGNVYVPVLNSDLYCLNAQTGAQVWVAGLSAPVESSPAVTANGYVYVGSEDNNVYCLNAQTGASLWHYQTGGAVSSSPAIVNGVLYIGSDDQKVYAFKSTQALQNATLSIDASSKHITNPPEYKLTISGTITPAQSGTVTIYESINGSAWGALDSYQASLSNGAYSNVHFTTDVGTYQFYAVWPGDSQYNPSQSSIVTVAVGVTQPTTPTLTCTPASSSLVAGSTMTITGSMTPAASGETITLTYTPPSGSPIARTVTTDSQGHYQDMYQPQSNGTWSVTASFAGDTQYSAASSPTATFTVGAEQPTSKGCVIATATYGSAMAPQVQALRDFRENIALNTFAGSSFMTVFNAWYYSWSPPVAAQIAPSAPLRGVMQVVLQPVLNILQVATYTYSSFTFNSEFAIFMAGFVTAALLGLVYVFPIATLGLFTTTRLKKNWNLPKMTSLKYLVMPWLVSIALIAIAEIALSPVLMMVASSAFILLTIIVIAGALSLQINRALKRA